MVKWNLRLIEVIEFKNCELQEARKLKLQKEFDEQVLPFCMEEKPLDK